MRRAPCLEPALDASASGRLEDFLEKFSSEDLVVMSPDGTAVAVGGMNGRLSLVDLDFTRSNAIGTARTVSSATRPFQQMMFSANSRVLAVADDHSISVIGTDGLPSWSLPFSAAVRDMAVSNDSEYVSVTDRDGRVHLCTRDGENLILTSSYKTRTAFSPDSRILAIAGETGEITLWDTGTREHVGTMEIHRIPIGDLTFSPDGRMLAAADTRNHVYLWPVPTP